jgi:hypothetical protein
MWRGVTTYLIPIKGKENFACPNAIDKVRSFRVVHQQPSFASNAAESSQGELSCYFSQRPQAPQLVDHNADLCVLRIAL